MSDTPETNKFRTSLDGMREINQRDRLLIHARRLERERDEAREEIENIKKLLLDPNAVRINMLHGQIAKLDWEKLEHIHGNHPAREQLAAERALADRLADALISTDAIIRKEVSLVGQWDSPVIFKEALTAWKEARSE